jgi:hypothetical protein
VFLQAVCVSSTAAVKGSTAARRLAKREVTRRRAPSIRDDPEVAPVWSERGRLTRFLESARLAFARERNLWASLELRSAEDVKLAATTARGTYKVALTQHLAAIRDEETLLASVLIHSYAVAETAAAERLGGDARDFGGIEDWGTRVLATTGSTWDSLKGRRCRRCRGRGCQERVRARRPAHRRARG